MGIATKAQADGAVRHPLDRFARRVSVPAASHRARATGILKRRAGSALRLPLPSGGRRIGCLRNLLPGLLSLALLAGPGLAAERPLVIFFGGYGATEADMRLWVEAAAREPRHGRAFDFEAIPYPPGIDSSTVRAVEASGATIEATAERIRALEAAGRRVVVVGHSSGAALAASVIALLGETSAAKLVSLDAGLNAERLPPPYASPERLECWSMLAGEQRAWGFRRTRELCRERFRTLRAPHCATPICLHFAIVNRNAATDLTFPRSREIDEAGISGGYRDLSVNLDWLAGSR